MSDSKETSSSSAREIVFAAIRGRRSVRNFAPTPIPPALLIELLELANRAPSGFNIQPWEFLVVEDENLKKLLRRVAMNQRQVTEAPAVIVVLANTNAWKAPFGKVLLESKRLGTLPEKAIENNRKTVGIVFRTGPFGLYGLAKRIAVPIRRLFAPTPNLVTSKAEAAQYVRAQAMLAAENLMIAAAGAGLGTSPMEGFDEYRLKRLLAIPLSYTVPLIIAVGYSADSKEAPRSVRLPLQEKLSWDLFGRKKHEL